MNNMGKLFDEVEVELLKQFKAITPERPWVGLTDDERRILWKKDSDLYGDELTYAEAIEAKLKEKNT